MADERDSTGSWVPPELRGRKVTLDDLLEELREIVMDATPEDLDAAKIRYDALYARFRRGGGDTCNNYTRHLGGPAEETAEERASFLLSAWKTYGRI